jgi:spermidine synthase
MPILSFISQIWHGLSLVIGFIFVYITSYLLGSIFPIVSHIGICTFSKNVSQKISWIYFSNIIGSTLGCVLTGFYFLDLLTFSQNIMLICSILSIIIFLMMFFYNQKYQSFAFIIISLLLVKNQDIFYTNFYKNIQGHKYFDTNENAKYILENKAGVITVFNHKDGDWIYGNGAYDGKFNIDPIVNSNDIVRAYKTVILHPEPKNILIIGLSSGSWAKAISMYQPLEKLDIVEINSGYKEIISHYKGINDIFHNPKVTLHLDDGRKWLKKYNGKKFDLIIMNTIYHWASNSTNLTSQDFLEISKKYLNSGGVIYMNTTGAEDVAYTASSVFKYTTMINNLVAVSDSPFNVSAKKRKENLQKFKYPNGNLVFDDNNPKLKKISEQIIATQLIDYNSSLKNRDDLWLITDDNMAGEYKKYHHFYQPKYKLKNILNYSK